jgi:hypothetical protein
MIFIAMVVSLIPGVVSLIMDPDILGISIFVIHALLVYIAMRSHIIGGILLIGLALLWLGLFIYNAIQDPMSIANILLWLGFVACPLAGGFLFFRLGKQKKEGSLSNKQD